MIPFRPMGLEGIMALRRIGQEVLHFGAKSPRETSLDELLEVIDFASVQQALAGLYRSAMGEKAWPPLDVQRAFARDLVRPRCATCRGARRPGELPPLLRFCAEEETPERTAFVRFRRLLTAHDLDQSLFEAIARDLESKGAVVRKGTLIDATVIGSASKGDRDAAWAKHKSRAPMHGAYRRRQRHGPHPRR
jgi:transposase, IS5 family